MNYDHLLSDQAAGISPNYDKHPSCPNCGACPHCGRGGYQTQPYNPYPPFYPTYPNWTSPDWTYRPGWITYTTYR